MTTRLRRSALLSSPALLAAEQDPWMDALAAELEIDTGQLSKELARQPELLYRVGRELALATTARDARRRELQAAIARVDALLRRAAHERGVVVTDQAIVVQTGDHADVVRAARACDVAKQKERALRRLHDAFLERGRMLTALTQLNVGR